MATTPGASRSAVAINVCGGPELARVFGTIMRRRPEGGNARVAGRMQRPVPERASIRAGAVVGLLGVVVFFAATALHPSDADPNDAVAAFQEYAADPLWVGTHLAQFLGILLIAASLMILARSLEVEPAGWLATVGSGGAVVSVAVAAVLQGVDGSRSRRWWTPG